MRVAEMKPSLQQAAVGLELGRLVLQRLGRPARSARAAPPPPAPPWPAARAAAPIWPTSASRRALEQRALLGDLLGQPRVAARRPRSTSAGKCDARAPTAARPRAAPGWRARPSRGSRAGSGRHRPTRRRAPAAARPAPHAGRRAPSPRAPCRLRRAAPTRRSRSTLTNELATTAADSGAKRSQAHDRHQAEQQHRSGPAREPARLDAGAARAARRIGAVGIGSARHDALPARSARPRHARPRRGTRHRDHLRAAGRGARGLALCCIAFITSAVGP